jgi:hypothetical protein
MTLDRQGRLPWPGAASAKSCGPGAATVASICPACAGTATVTTNAAHRGEHEVSRKTFARGKPGCPGCTCGLTRVRFLAHSLHTGLRAQSAPGFPAPSDEEGANESANPGRSRRGNENACLSTVIASEAKQSSYRVGDRWIASAFAQSASADSQPCGACAASGEGSSRSLSSGARSRDPLAPRNDGVTWRSPSHTASASHRASHASASGCRVAGRARPPCRRATALPGGCHARDRAPSRLSSPPAHGW